MKRVLALALAASLLGAGAASASEGPELAQQSWSFDGVFGQFDRAAMQRGFQVYKEVCANCHSLNYVAFRNLTDLGFSEEEAKAIAAGYQIVDGPNDAGDMFERPGRLSDRFPHPFPNDQAARASNNGALPPNLSLITKARPGGPDHLYGILTGYREPPAGVTVGDGMYYNLAMPGNQIAMPPPLSEGQVTFADGTPASVEQMARDVTTFLSWSAEPKLEERKNAGIKAFLFLVLLTGLFYLSKRRVWSALH
jgi:ubiquinol-cytochrome c reductase cytochrome c1 subunit